MCVLVSSRSDSINIQLLVSNVLLCRQCRKCRRGQCSSIYGAINSFNL